MKNALSVISLLLGIVFIVIGFSVAFGVLIGMMVGPFSWGPEVENGHLLLIFVVGTCGIMVGIALSELGVKIEP